MNSPRRRIALKTVLILAACLALAVPVLRQAQDVVLAQISAAFDLFWHVIGGGEDGERPVHPTVGAFPSGCG
jgi:hypothetical protein